MATMRETCDFVTWFSITGHERVKLGNKTPQSSDSATINWFIADFRVDAPLRLSASIIGLEN